MLRLINLLSYGISMVKATYSNSKGLEFNGELGWGSSYDEIRTFLIS